MDVLTSPLIYQSALLVAALFCYREAWTPPNKRADATIRAKTETRRLIEPFWSRRFAAAEMKIILPHLILEIYALLYTNARRSGAKTVLNPIFDLIPLSSICPLQPTPRQSAAYIYPTQHLPPTALVALSLIIVGGLIRGSCHRRLGNMFTWENSLLKDHRLITDGPYAFVRHPAYLGLTAVSVGYAILLMAGGTFGKECFLGGPGSNPSPKLLSLVVGDGWNLRNAFGRIFVMFTWVHHIDSLQFLIRRSFEEDKMLKKKFEKEWEEWAGRVRYNVFPFLL